MALGEWIESRWFKLLWRGSAILSAAILTVGGGLYTWSIIDTRHQISEV